MSLKGEIQDPFSPASEFFAERFPFVKAAGDWARYQLGKWQERTIHPPEPVRMKNELLTRVGMAVDYRLRYYFERSSWRELGPPTMGARAVTELAPPRKREAWVALIEEFGQCLEGTLRRLNPAGRLLTPEEDMALCQFCYVLSLFEQVYRAPGYAKKSPLLSVNPQRRNPVAKLLTTNQECPVLEDLVRLSQAFYANQSSLLQRPTQVNPTFEGSYDVRGADADLIVDNCLIDTKTSNSPSLSKRNLYQLLGYVLLDYSDLYHIAAVGLYFARQATLVWWPLDQFLFLLGGESVPELDVLRREFKLALRGPCD